MPTQKIIKKYITDIKKLQQDVKKKKMGMQKQTVEKFRKTYKELEKKYSKEFPFDERVRYFNTDKTGKAVEGAKQFVEFDMAMGGMIDDEDIKTQLFNRGYLKDQPAGTGAGEEKEDKQKENKAEFDAILEETTKLLEGEKREQYEASLLKVVEEEAAKTNEVVSIAKAMANVGEEKEMDKVVMTDSGTKTEEETKEEETQTPNVSMTMTPMPSPVELPRSRETQEKKKADFIPRERLSVEGKTADELRDDIKYFLKEFKPQLKEEATIFKRVKTLDDLQRLQRRIIGKLQPDEEPKEEKRRMLEVDMERYIDERVQRLIMENMMSSVKPEAVMINVEGQAKKKAKDVGSYELKANKGGKMFAKREPIYRAIPSTNPEDIDEQFDPYGKPAKVLKGAPTKKRTLATTAKRQFMQSPFRRPMQTIDLKYIA